MNLYRRFMNAAEGLLSAVTALTATLTEVNNRIRTEMDDLAPPEKAAEANGAAKIRAVPMKGGK